MMDAQGLAHALTPPQRRLLRDAAAYGNAFENIGLRQRAVYGQVAKRLGDMGLLTRSAPYRSTKLGGDTLAAIDYDAARQLREGNIVEIHEIDARSNSWIWLAVGPGATGGTVIAAGGTRSEALARIVGSRIAFPADGCEPPVSAAIVRANRDPVRGDLLRLGTAKRPPTFRVSRIETMPAARARLLGLRGIANKLTRVTRLERQVKAS